MVNPITNNRTRAAGHNGEIGAPKDVANGRPVAQAVASVAKKLRLNSWPVPQLVMRNFPEAAPMLMKALHQVFAKERNGLAKLYNAFALTDAERIPSAQELQDDLNITCKINNLCNSDFLFEAIKEFCNQFLEPSIDLDNISADQLNKLATSSAVLVNALGKSWKNTDNKYYLSDLDEESLQKLAQLYDHAETWNSNELEYAQTLIEVSLNPFPLHNLNNRYQKNPDLVIVAAQKRFMDFRLASDECKNNPDLVMAAVKKNYLVLQFASADCKNNPKVLTEAVKQNAMALQFAGNNCKDNPNIVTLAVERNPMTLQFAGDHCKNDPKIVTLAVQKNGLALQFVGDDCKNAEKILTIALKNNRNAVEFVSEENYRTPKKAKK